MASLATTVILVSVLFSGLFGDGRAVELVSAVTQQTDFDYFVLAVEWPASFCATLSQTCCPENACCDIAKNPPSGFTIHGLWPDYEDGTWPSCCAGTPFNENALSSLSGALNKYWPRLSCSETASCTEEKRSFWANQWEEHGTCATSVTGQQYSYFVTAISLYLKYDVTEALFKAGYVPSDSDTYPSKGISSAIKKVFHKTPKLSCNSDGTIKEVHLCFTKDFQPRECVAASTCPDYLSIPVFEARNSTKAHGRYVVSA